MLANSFEKSIPSAPEEADAGIAALPNQLRMSILLTVFISVPFVRSLPQKKAQPTGGKNPLAGRGCKAVACFPRVDASAGKIHEKFRIYAKKRLNFFTQKAESISPVPGVAEKNNAGTGRKILSRRKLRIING
jgi:hypothetical protein